MTVKSSSQLSSLPLPFPRPQPKRLSYLLNQDENASMALHVKLFRSLLLIFDEDLKLLTWINCGLIDGISSQFNVDVNFLDVVSVFIYEK